MSKLLSAIYVIGLVGTYVYLTFLDGYTYTATNWIIAIPVNVLLSAVWPLYWTILFPVYMMSGVQQTLRGG